MTHASLFTGIGGFDLAAEWIEWENIFQCEIDDYCNKLLQQNFPNTIKHGNIKETDFTVYRDAIDVLSGGFPCQPYSTAGKRLGKEDDRHLWPEMLRAIREIQPRWIVGENVRGLTNWNSGLVFDEVQSDMEAEGYEVTPFLLPACGVNAPHRRDRIWFIAHSSSNGYEPRELERIREDVGGISETGYSPNPPSIGQQGSRGAEYSSNQTPYGNGQASWSNNDGGWPTQSPVCRRDDGISNRLDRLKSLGNAVVPQVVLQIFKAIEQYEKSSHE